MGYCNDGKYETTVINNQLKPPNMCTDDWSRSIEQAKATNPSSLSSFRWQMRSHMAFVWIIWYHLACKYVFVCVCVCGSMSFVTAVHLFVCGWKETELFRISYTEQESYLTWSHLVNTRWCMMVIMILVD